HEQGRTAAGRRHRQSVQHSKQFWHRPAGGPGLECVSQLLDESRRAASAKSASQWTAESQSAGPIWPTKIHAPGEPRAACRLLDRGGRKLDLARHGGLSDKTFQESL